MVSEQAKLHIALVFTQICHAANQILMRIALNEGVSKLIFLVYRNVSALFLLATVAYFSDKKDRPAITTYIVMQFALLGVVGITLKEGFYIFGLDNTSPTFASAMQNSVPALTFLLAVLLRFENVNLKRIESMVKVLGVLVSVAGASVITLYKGPIIYTPGLTLHQSQFFSSLGDATGKSWNLGCISLLAHCLCWSGWIVMQASILKKYPAPFTVSAFTCFFGALQFLTIAAIFENDSKAWQLNPVELCSALYAGLVASGLAAAISIWTIKEGGPVFASIYQPVQTLIVALMASIALRDEFFLGGIIGALLIISGLYLVVWGKSVETKSEDVKVLIENSDSSSLLQSLLPAENS